MDADAKSVFEGWCVLELMGHRRLGGYVREQEIAGQGFIRIDVPRGDGAEFSATQFYSPGSVYCLTPTTEAMARAVAKRSQPEPVQRWELPAPSPGVHVASDGGPCDDDDEDDNRVSF